MKPAANHKAPAGVWGVVLAAGLASRYGGGKQLALLQGRALAAWPVEAALAAGLERVLAVLGHGARKVAAAIPAAPHLETLVNPDYAQGMGSSLALAARKALAGGAQALVVLLGDQPLVQPQVIARVAEAALQSPVGASSARDGGRRAHPVAFARRHLEELAGLDGDQGGREIMARLGAEVALVEAPEGSALDVDRAEDLARAEALAVEERLLDWAAPGRLCRALGIYGPQVTALAGSGGKTTLMYLLAQEIAQAGRKAIVTTTTRIFPPQAGQARAIWLWGADSPPGEEIARRLAEPGSLCLAARATAEGKLTGLDLKQMEFLGGLPDLWTLVEADGSARRPLKGWAAHEPVWPVQTRTLLVLAGASALGRPLSGQQVHRPEAFAEATGLSLGELITPAALAQALCGGQGPLRARPPLARAVCIINQSDAAPPEMLAALMRELERLGKFACLCTASLRQGRLEIWRGD